VDSLAGIDIHDDDDMVIDPQKLAEEQATELSSIASSANAMTLEEARAEVQNLKTEKYLAEQALEVERKTKAAAAAKKVSPNQLLHTRIVSNSTCRYDQYHEGAGLLHSLVGCAVGH
jgi:capsule polysaccharide export protein KpsE/RkpR